MSISRRQLLVGCSSAIAAMAGSRVECLAFSPEPGKSDQILVVVFFRGGMDGLNLLAPVNDHDYIDARPTHLRILDSGNEQGLSLKGGPAGLDFRLHHKAGPLKELYDSGALAFVHACGLTNGTRSHFEAMDIIERGIENQSGVGHTNGWLTRLVAARHLEGQIPAAAITGSMPSSLLGSPQASAIPQLNAIRFYGNDDQMKALHAAFKGQDWLSAEGARALSTLEYLKSHVPRKPNGEFADYGGQYPQGELANSLKTLAQLIRSDCGLSVATVDLGGWDTHQNQNYHFSVLAEQVSRALQAFWNDLSTYHGRLNVVVLSEFGRRLKANQSNGTDHGHGNVAMVLGGGVRGGRILGKWPGLATEQLDSRADLAVTTDYRSVLSELMTHRLGIQNTASVLPGFKGSGSVGLY